MTSILITIFTVVLVAFAGNVQASPGSCSTIKDNSARLACFDLLFPNQSTVSIAVPTAEKETADPPQNVVEVRQLAERKSITNWFAITPHKQNYILPATFSSSPDYDSIYGQTVGDLFSDSEIKFQLSLKTLVIEDLWKGSNIVVGYTQQSYWQLFAEAEISAPFRETNHEPEIMWNVPLNFEVFGFRAEQATLAFNHQSNGQSQPLSRSWNRVTGELVFAKNRIALSAKTWKRIIDNGVDDNPSIEDFMGRIQLGAAYKGERHTFALGIKSSLGSNMRNGTEFSWTFPLTGKLRGFVQVYSGYGENLIDMENYNNRIGVGIALTDWL